ncbi:MAG: hypothetical protein KME13_18370 [Myxacorys californica WJT36-NPBG1]|jgi:hypothetical protein|nr:hypothetical protein [Myxacorys californica WJT36-NPBG1]
MKVEINLDCDMNLCLTYLLFAVAAVEIEPPKEDNTLICYERDVEGKPQIMKIEITPSEIDELDEQRIKWYLQRKDSLKKSH